MSLHRLNNSKKDHTFIYARNSEHIIELVEHYRGKLTSEQLNNPELHTWVRKVPTIEDILEVESGSLIFQAGIVDMSLEGDLFEEIKVTDDFSVFVNLESLPYFEICRNRLPQSKRCNLYKFQSPGGLFKSQNFIPEDIMQAIKNYNLIPYFEKAKKVLEKIEGLKEHPNVNIRFHKV